MRANEFIAEYKNTNDPAFKQWFGNSKVVDGDGDPLMVYHGTLFNDEIKSFHDLSHFGTIGSANQRIADILKLHKDFPGSRSLSHPEQGKESPHIYPVFLKIETPFKIADSADWAWSDVWMEIVNTADYYQNKIIEQLIDDYGQEEVEENVYNIEEDSIDSYRLIDYILTMEENPWEFLKSLGHDGIYYVNQHEDAGNISWVPFSGKQVKSAF